MLIVTMTIMVAIKTHDNETNHQITKIYHVTRHVQCKCQLNICDINGETNNIER